MPLDTQERTRLEDTAHRLRNLCLDTVVWAHSGHIGGSMSAMDILTILYHKYMRFDPKNPDWPDRDRLVVSKGHIGIGHAPVLADLGFFDRELLKDFNLTGSKLGIHLDSNKVPGVDTSTGSLGHGLPMAAGLGLAARLSKRDYKTYCILGDGESNEGAVWEAAMGIAHFNITNVVTFVDHNRLMIDGAVAEVMNIEPIADKWRAFGFDALVVNGHSFTELSAAIDTALAATEKPVCIICETVKGCGIDFMENNYKWHYGALDDKGLAEARASLAAYHQKRLKEVH